jgi:hypothetical protein
VLDHLAGGGHAAVEEAHHRGIAVEVDQEVRVSRSEPAQQHTFGFQVDLHPALLPAALRPRAT